MTQQMDMFSNQRKFQLRDFQLGPISVERDGVYISDWIGGVDPKGKLELNKNYEITASTVAKILDILVDSNRPKGSMHKNIADIMGVTRAETKSLLNYTRAMELIVPIKLTLTPLGEIVYQYDPSIVDIGCLWLLHYLAASNPYLVVWNFLFNQILPNRDLKSKSKILDKYKIFTGRWTDYTINNKVRGELRALFKSYSDYLFKGLDIIRFDSKSDKLKYGFGSPVPPLIFLSSTLAFRDRYHPGATAMGIQEIANNTNSPGRLFFLNELEVRRLLDQLHEVGWLSLESRANLDQVRFRQDVSWLKAAALYFEG